MKAVVLHKKHEVTASYAPVKGSNWSNDLLHVGIRLPSGRRVGLFVNRDTGLIVVDVIHKNSRFGNEILRINANEVTLPKGKALPKD